MTNLCEKKYTGDGSNEQRIFIKDARIGWRSLLSDPMKQLGNGIAQYEYLVTPVSISLNEHFNLNTYLLPIQKKVHSDSRELKRQAELARCVMQQLISQGLKFRP